jgi:cytochrome c
MIDFGNKNPQWTPELLSAFVHSPKTEVPGTKMTFPGISDQAEVDNVVAYLVSLSPKYVPAAGGATAPAAPAK